MSARAKRVRVADGQARTAADRLREWTDSQGAGAQSKLAEKCKVARQRISEAIKGGPVSPPLRRAIEVETGIEASAWDEATAPVSGPREVVMPELGSTPDEIRASVRRALSLLTEKEITVKQRLDAEGRIQVGLATLARLEERASLEDHPEFSAKLEIILDALDATFRQFGINPVGAREAWVDHVDRLEKTHKRAA